MSDAEETLFDDEIRRALAAYAERHAKGYAKAAWAPFAVEEVAHRTQQYTRFARLMREAGFVDLSGLRILDVGCGSGRQTRSFVDMGARPDDVVGIDISADAIETARHLAPGIRYDVFNGRRIDLPDGHFDLVTQFVVFSSIGVEALRQRLARDMLRVLKPGGYVFWWDLRVLASLSGQAGAPLDVGTLFPGLPMRTIVTALHDDPGAGIRPMRGRRIIRAVVDALRHPRTHVAALVGPKS
jgi:SAM-dependent methyltransferase